MFDRPRLLVWDVLTGVVVSNIGNPSTREFGFSCNRRIVDLLGNYFGGYSFCVYDAPQGKQLRDEGLEGWPDRQLGAHWAYKDNLRFATGSTIDGKYVIEVHELQKSLGSPLLLVESFPIPRHDGTFSFSPGSFHASFVTESQVVVLDVRTSKRLLGADVKSRSPPPPGWFSPDGRFFAFEMSQYEICVRQNTSTHYVPWSNFRSRLPFEGFLSSLTASSMLTWSAAGIQLLHPDTLPSPAGSRGLGHHLVAYFADCARIATTRLNDSVVTVLDCPLGTLRQSVDMVMDMRDIGVVGDIVFGVKSTAYARWDSEAGREAPRGWSPSIDFVDLRGAPDRVGDITLSRDCSQVAITEDRDGTISARVHLHGIKPPGAVASFEMRHLGDIIDIQFSPDQHELWLLDRVRALPRDEYRVTRLEVVGSGGGRFRVIKETLNSERGTPQSVWPWVHLFSRGYRIGSGARWIRDPGDTKILWLPPSWRSADGGDVKWEGKFLAFLSSHHPAPIVIEFTS